jgi:hypothetical protein
MANCQLKKRSVKSVIIDKGQHYTPVGVFWGRYENDETLQGNCEESQQKTQIRQKKQFYLLILPNGDLSW